MSEDTVRRKPDSGRTEVMTEAGFGPRVKWSKFEAYRKQLPVFLAKNSGLATDPFFWKMLPRLIAQRRRSAAAPDTGPRLFVATHHKSMTTYFNAVLRLFTFANATRFEKINGRKLPAPDTRIFLSNHSKFDLGAVRPYRGIHLMRDPRDMIVSGYHYHKWTYEFWARRPDENGVSYQQKLNSRDRSAGLFMEIDHFIFMYRELLERWNMDDPDILEIRYEALMGEEREALYEEIFRFFGYEGERLSIGVDLMRLFEAKRRTGRDKDAATPKHQHIRSGRSEQWRKELSDAHLDYIEAQLGQVLRKFGYAPH